MSTTNEQSKPFMVNVFPTIVKQGYIDVDMTEKIKNHIEKQTDEFLDIEENLNQNFIDFDNLRILFENLLSCDDMQKPYSWAWNYGEENALSILSYFRIKATSYMTFCMYDKDKICVNDKAVQRKYLFFILSNTVLLFIDPRNKPIVFLCALKTNAFSVYFKPIVIKKSVTVLEASREPIEYYNLKYNPVPDSKILSLNWEKTNNDGSRSFRGGLKPENNPLLFYYEYGMIALRICDAQLNYKFSNCDLAEKFAEIYVNFAQEQQPLPFDNNIKQNEIYNAALAIVEKSCAPAKKSLYEKFKALKPIQKVILISLIIFAGMSFINLIAYLILNGISDFISNLY